MLGACCPITNVGASAMKRVVSAQVKLLESVVADESITEELAATGKRSLLGKTRFMHKND